MSEFDARAKGWEENPVHTLRTEAIAREIRARIPLSRSMRALEVGCGTGLLSFALREELGTIVPTDTSEGMLEVLREKIKVAGITNMQPLRSNLLIDPLPPGTFDLIFSQMALHHIPDVDALLGVFHDLLAKGGHLCIADLQLEDGSFHGEGFEGHHGFAQAELIAKCERAGFEKLEIDVVFEIEREVGGIKRGYPVFLLSALR
ncbi:MAG TPA: class I SAM-dependent methyltransferase [Cyanobacteria bacterium UBA8530]|nr:class I SAM-dependent methyltransferase [Cyanobacteria bacterium UBA8530]